MLDVRVRSQSIRRTTLETLTIPVIEIRITHCAVLTTTHSISIAREPAIKPISERPRERNLEQLLLLKEARGLGAEGAVFLVSSQHCGLSFQLSESGSDAPPENWDRAALARLPKSTVVDRVVIVGCDPPAS